MSETRWFIVSTMLASLWAEHWLPKQPWIALFGILACVVIWIITAREQDIAKEKTALLPGRREE